MSDNREKRERESESSEKRGKEELCVSENNGGNQARHDRRGEVKRTVIFRESGCRSMKE